MINYPACKELMCHGKFNRRLVNIWVFSHAKGLSGCADPERFVRVCTTLTLLFFNWWGERRSKYHHKQSNISPPAKRHLNGVLLACRCWSNIQSADLVALWFFRGSGPVLLGNPIFLWFFRGGPDLCPPPSGSAHGVFQCMFSCDTAH